MLRRQHALPGGTYSPVKKSKQSSALFFVVLFFLTVTAAVSFALTLAYLACVKDDTTSLDSLPFLKYAQEKAVAAVTASQAVSEATLVVEKKRPTFDELISTRADEIWNATCGNVYEDTLAVLEDAPILVVNTSRPGIRHAFAAQICVSREKGLWIVPGEDQPETTEETTELQLSLSCLPSSDAPPTRISTGRVPENAEVHDVPAIIMGTYETGHLSHYFYNNVYGFFANYLRLGRNPDTVWIMTSVHGGLSYTNFLDTFLTNGTQQTYFTDKYRRKSLPPVPQCFGPAIVGCRSHCPITYCAEFTSPVEHLIMVRTMLNSAGIPMWPPRTSPRVTVVNRRKTRRITNADDVMLALTRYRLLLSSWCAGLDSLKSLGSPDSGKNVDPMWSLLEQEDITSLMCTLESPFEIQLLELETATTNDQLWAFAASDIAVMMHGNAVMNTGWMRTGSAVIELFPLGFDSPWFEKAVKNTYLHHYQGIHCNKRSCWPATEAEEAAELEETKDNPGKRDNAVKSRNIAVPMDELNSKFVTALTHVYSRMVGHKEGGLMEDDDLRQPSC